MNAQPRASVVGCWVAIRIRCPAVIESACSPAGGKTEAAFFPVVSRMLSEDWKGLSVLYICPIKALLNNLDLRLQRYCTLLGRRSALWHGDIKSSARTSILREAPDCLLTTPESLEVMLVSPTSTSAGCSATCVW